MRRFDKSGGYTTKDLIHYGLDHLAASIELFSISPRLYDSAGYLAHLGIELYLKAMMFYDKGYFINEHKLDMIRNRGNLSKSYFDISSENTEIYNRLDEFAEIRYPTRSNPQNIGEEDADKIRSLSEEIYDHFPQQLKDEFDAIDHNKKGGRDLWRRKKD